MTQFATAAELGQRLGITLDAAEIIRANALLVLTSGMIQHETGQTIELIADDELLWRGRYSGRLRLPQRPVVSVSELTVDGEALVEDDDWYLAGDTIVRLSVARPLHGAGFGYPWQPLTVTYTHGYATIPDAIKGVCLEAVVRVWTNPGNVQREGYGPEQVGYQNSDGLILSDAEREVVRAATGSANSSVQLR